MKRRTLPYNISEDDLRRLYCLERKSVAQISHIFKCSQNKINYWLAKFKIPKRSISEAIYHLKNPQGDPFIFIEPKTLKSGILFGMGLALYWGEGAKRGTGAVRLSNADPKLIYTFIQFLKVIFQVDKNKLRFGLQIFKDISPSEALSHWTRELKVKPEQFYKPTYLKVRGMGTYNYKSKHGTAILYFNNIKLKRIICKMIENIR
jgi:hypothetical protein